MPNKLPPEVEQALRKAAEQAYTNETGKEPDDILRELISEIIDRFSQYQGSYEYAPPEADGRKHTTEITGDLIAYFAMGMARVVGYALQLADDNPPSHRKGVGEEDYTVIEHPDPIIFVHGGHDLHGGYPPIPGGGGGVGGGYPTPPDQGPPDSGMVEWAPSSEVERAKALVMAKGIGPFEDPVAFIRSVARALGGHWGLFEKPSGGLSADLLAWDVGHGLGPQAFDILFDAGGRSQHTQWNPVPWGGKGKWVAP